MADDWSFYTCKVNDVVASIFLDLGLRNQIPDLSKPELLWIWVEFKWPRPDGLSSSSEFDALVAIEKQLTESSKQNFDAVLCGRITTDGRREFYYYGSHSAGFESAVADALGHFPGYEFECGAEKDPGWKQYLDVLYPSEEDFQRIQNRTVVEVLEGKGDTLKAPRDILHWVYFRTREDRDGFWAAVQPLGYRRESHTDKAQGEFPFGSCIVRFESVKENDVDEAIIELFRLVKEFHGEYDRWETQVIAN